MSYGSFQFISAPILYMAICILYNNNVSFKHNFGREKGRFCHEVKEIFQDSALKLYLLATEQNVQGALI